MDLDYVLKTGANAHKTVRDVFIAKVDRSPDACWHWTGGCFSNGYGSFSSRGKDHLAHRVSFEIAHGRPPSGVLMHTCDNRMCVNPMHLIEGTASDNIKDMLGKGRGNPRRGSAHLRAVLSDADVAEIRASAKAGVARKSLALKYGVSVVQITRVVNNTRRTSIKENKNMTPSEYMQKAMRTKNPLGFSGDVTHAAMLLTSEAGEVATEVKRFVVYGKDLDRLNIKEELGDIMWGVALMCDTLGFTLEEVMEKNIAKLETRYPEKKFDAGRAIDRDKEAEQEAMK